MPRIEFSLDELYSLLDAMDLPYDLASLGDDEEFEMLEEHNASLASAQRKLVRALEEEGAD